MFADEWNAAGSSQDAAARPVADRAEICARIKATRAALAALGVRLVRLFGSAARDALRPDSDVDILIEFDGPTRFRAFMATRRLLEQTLGRRVDLVTPAALKPLAARIARELVDAA
jgi:predicted nucleotidyltransferase